MPIKFHNLISFALFKDRLDEGLHPEWNTMLDSGGFTNYVRGKDVITLKDAVKYLERSVKKQHQADTHHDLIYLLTRAHEAYKNSKK